MNTKPKYAMQTGGMNHVWASPDGRFKHTFLKLNFDCDADRRPGIVIVTNENYNPTLATDVQDLRKELPALLADVHGRPVAYWWHEQDQREKARILSGLSRHPVFADIR